MNFVPNVAGTIVTGSFVARGFIKQFIWPRDEYCGKCIYGKNYT
jgi:hypothetical protein